uniref:Uncharacterized protein n=1 Tax=Rhizophora mucronata TaxID=61149 RepID=A0A2P2R384_RHIMU
MVHVFSNISIAGYLSKKGKMVAKDVVIVVEFILLLYVAANCHNSLVFLLLLYAKVHHTMGD